MSAARLWHCPGALRSLGAVHPSRSTCRTARGAAQRVRSFVGPAAAPASKPPTSTELLRDSRLAGLSGLAYMPAEELEGRLRPHGLELEAHGTTHFTRWFVARHSDAATAAAAAAATGAPHNRPGAGPTSTLLGADPNVRYIFLRGVSWRSADLDAFRVWQGLARALPTAFMPHLTSPPELLMAHSGVADMAGELFDVLRPHLEGQPRLHLAGHSLGGSLATLVGLTAHLKLGGTVPTGSSANGGSTGASGSAGSAGSSAGAVGMDQQQQPQQQRQVQQRRHEEQQQQERRLQVAITTFGSPPVLSLAEGAEEDGQSILQALRLPLGSVRNYVLQDDPIPRAMLSADPAFTVLKQSPAVAGLLRLREQWLGQGVISPTRFLYHPAGDVFLVRWSPDRGHSVRQLGPGSLKDELALDVEALRTSPMALMQAVMDHHHGSYSTELRAAAAALARQEAAAAAAAGRAAAASGCA